MVTKEQALKYYKNKKKAEQIILRNAKRKGHVIYGARAVNKQLPKHLQKTTEDYDIFSTTPKRTARKVERKIDKTYGFNIMKTEPALHEGTHKVINRVTNRGLADYSKTPKKIRTITRKKIKYAHLSHQQKQIIKSLADKESKFRHKKDLETRQRINLAKIKLKKKRKKPTMYSIMFKKENIKRGGKIINATTRL